MSQTPLLLPTPRHLALNPGVHVLTGSKIILLAGPQPQALRFAAGRFQTALLRRLSLDWELAASPATPAHLIGLALRIRPELIPTPQGYELSIEPERIDIAAHDEAGAFYALSTLIQILEHSGEALPCLHISDWPDFPVRGVMLDISRDKVPTNETLFALVDLLAGWKINQLQLYTEHTFAYRRHPQVWAAASPLTGQEILALDAYCRERFIELVPNQNCFGHLQRWLIHPAYAPLAEVTDGFEAPWGPVAGPFSLCPTDPGSLELVSSLFDELLPHFTSRMVNVGCDETFDLGQGRSREACARQGVGAVYLEFLLKIYADLNARGYTMQYWGDILLEHPELIPYLPKDAIALNWGYEADHPFDRETALLEAAGLPYYVCPGTSSWSSLAGRTANALGNLLNAAENGLKHGAKGYLNTDWGDNGHWQTLPVSFTGFAAGAAYAWALEANRALELPEALNRYAFHNAAGALGRAAYQLGNLYKVCGVEWFNGSALNWILQQPLAILRQNPTVQAIPYPTVLAALDESERSLAFAGMQAAGHPLAQPEQVCREFNLTIRMLRHACRRGVLATAPTGADTTPLRHELNRDLQTLVEDYRMVWLARNRPGGLADSLARLEKLRADYDLSEV